MRPNMKKGALIVLLLLFSVCFARAEDPEDNPPEPFCGDDVCSISESCSTCSADCGECPETCGNGTCDTDEDCSNCSADCGECPASCGDGTCDTDADEDCSTCSDDCGECLPICSEVDENSDHFVTDLEMSSYIREFFHGNVSLEELMEAITDWKSACFE
jgi:hypothetical protein